MSKQLHLGRSRVARGVVPTEPDSDDAAVSPAPAVALSAVTVNADRRRSTAALHDFTLRVAHGETVALVGPDGSGASTVLRAVAGLVTPAHGRLLLPDDEVTGRVAATRGVGLVPSVDALSPRMTVAENVTFGLRGRRMSLAATTAAVNDALRMVGISDSARRSPRELTDADRQKVTLARALVTRPTVLLIDDAGGAGHPHLLDVVTRLRTARTSPAIMVVPHTPAEALAVADRIAVMCDGHLVDVGTPDELWDRPPSEFTARCLGDANLIGCTVGRVYGASAMVAVGDRMLSAIAYPRATCQLAPGSAAILCIRPHDVDVCAASAAGASTARITRAQWRGAWTRLTMAVDGLPDQPVIADVDGRAPYPTDAVIGVKFPARSCVLVPPARGIRTSAARR